MLVIIGCFNLIYGIAAGLLPWVLQGRPLEDATRNVHEGCPEDRRLWVSVPRRPDAPFVRALGNRQRLAKASWKHTAPWMEQA